MMSLERVNIRTNERTYVCTYVRTYSHTYVRDRPYIPSTTLLCEGISNICVKLYRNWIINEVARAGEHTNERTYVRMYVRTYVLTYIHTGQTLYPLHNFVVLGDNNLKLSFISGDLSRCFFRNAMKMTAPIVTASFGSRLSVRKLCYNVINSSCFETIKLK